MYPPGIATQHSFERRLEPTSNYASVITAGSTLHFQYWFRTAMNAGDLDGDGTVEPFHATNALRVFFQ